MNDTNRSEPITQAMPTRTIPSSGESLGVIGFGTARIFDQSPITDNDTPKELLQLLLDHGGNYLDTGGNPGEKNLVGWLNEMDALDQAFMGSSVGSGYDLWRPIADDLQGAMDTRGGRPIDFAKVGNTADMADKWPVLQEWKEAGKARYIGGTVNHHSQYDKLELFMRKYQPDIIQVNYSILEPKAEERILPVAKDLGVGVIIMRPFVNGDYFQKVLRHPLPEWAAEFDCTSWSHFATKYVLANQGVTCVMAESSKPKHARDNLQGAFGRLPDAGHLKRMRELMKWI